MVWKKLQGSSFPASWDPAKENVIEGNLTEVKDDIGSNQSRVYILSTDNGLRTIWESAGLRDSMDMVQTGQRVRVTFEGRKINPRSGREFKSFTVEIDDE